MCGWHMYHTLIFMQMNHYTSVLTNQGSCRGVVTRPNVADLPEVHWSRDLWPTATPAASLGGVPTALPVTFGQVRKIEIN